MESNGKTQLAVRRSPLPEFDDLRENIRALLDTRWPFTLAPSRLPFGFERQPVLDMFEREGNVVVKVEMPGIAPENVDVFVSDNELRISGERKEEKEVSEENYYRSERSYGRIVRALTLPAGCDNASVVATSKDGVVEIVIPKKASAVSKKVSVKPAD
jgi:HSP20 family protein